MLALIYLAIMIALGDAICRRVYDFRPLPVRFAAAFLAGLLLSSWASYVSAWLFSGTSAPMFWGSLLFFPLAILTAFLLYRFAPSRERRDADHLREEFHQGDWITFAVIFVLVAWMMFATMNMSDGKVQIANQQWSDFGSNVSIIQSFALGHNFPTEYPHFSGERIRYHFLFYFQAGNLEYLGFNPAFANNILSIFSVVSLLALVWGLGVVLFGSRWVGRIGALLFFFHGSLAFTTWLWSKPTWSDLWTELWKMTDFLSSGYTYRGELWGVWSQVVFLNQRHFASSIGILVLVLLFLVTRYKRKQTDRKSGTLDTLVPPAVPRYRGLLHDFGSYIFSGVLLGLLPLWNGPVFLAAAVVLAILFMALPLRLPMVPMGVVAGVIALPQVLYLRGGNMREAGYSLWHWGYTVDDATFANVTKYLGFTFGFKWLLIAIALVFAARLHRTLFAAMFALIAVAFCFQFSDEVLANHKFLNIWLVIANVYVAYGLVKIWELRPITIRIPARVLAAILAFIVMIGGFIDLFPIRNGYWMEVPLYGDKLVEWLHANTDPRAVFLSHRYVNHRILIAGRKLFYGHPYYSWSAGYDTAGRDRIYKQLLQDRDARSVFDLIKANNISYVVFDDQLRNDREIIKNHNELLYQAYCDVVFDDVENRFDRLRIYKVPEEIGEPKPGALSSSPFVTLDSANTPPPNLFDSREGKGLGEFIKPRGIAVDANGSIYVADTGNSRIQLFDADGNFILAFGRPGAGFGEIREPNGIAVDEKLNVYVVDAFNHKLVKFASNGEFIKEWKGPGEGFYGPRDIAVGPNKALYILDQGRNRVVRFDPEKETFREWGSAGVEAGQFNDATGISVGGGLVFVADSRNNRIQVFDLDGKFVRQWSVLAWEGYIWHYPDTVYDEQARRLFVTSGWSHEVLIFGMDGSLVGSFRPPEEIKLANPSSIVLQRSPKRRLVVVDTDSGKVVAIDPATGAMIR